MLLSMITCNDYSKRISTANIKVIGLHRGYIITSLKFSIICVNDKFESS